MDSRVIPVITDSGSSVVVAARRCGQGRILVVASPLFLTDSAAFDAHDGTKRLLLNAIDWLTQTESPHTLCYMTGTRRIFTEQLGCSVVSATLFDELDQYQLVVVRDTDIHPQHIDMLNHYLGNGGGLIVAGCGVLSLADHALPLALMPANQLLAPHGLAFSHAPATPDASGRFTAKSLDVCPHTCAIDLRIPH